MENNPTTEVIEVLSTSSPIEGIERAQIDMQIATARKHPRILSQVKQDMIGFATLDEDTAATCFYTIPRGGKSIQGPSIRLAEIAVSCYGNLRAGSRILSVETTGDNPHVIVQAVAHDLQKNVAISIEKRRRIVGKKDYATGARKPVDEDDINLAVNACTAIAFRDAVFKVVPLALIKPVFDQAKRVAVGEASSLSSKRSKVIDRLKQMGVQEPRILNALECRKVEDIGMDKLEVLIGLGTAIKDGEVSVDQAFPEVKTQPVEVALPITDYPDVPRRRPGRPRKQAATAQESEPAVEPAAIQDSDPNPTQPDSGSQDLI